MIKNPPQHKKIKHAEVVSLRKDSHNQSQIDMEAEGLGFSGDSNNSEFDTPPPLYTDFQTPPPLPTEITKKDMKDNFISRTIGVEVVTHVTTVKGHKEEFLNVLLKRPIFSFCSFPTHPESLIKVLDVTDGTASPKSVLFKNSTEVVELRKEVNFHYSIINIKGLFKPLFRKSCVICSIPISSMKFSERGDRLILISVEVVQKDQVFPEFRGEVLYSIKNPDD